MAKVYFSVTAIRPGRRDDYYDFWTRDIKVNDKGEDLHPALLATTVGVDAKSKRDAEDQVRKLHPDHSIDSPSTKRHG